VRTKPEIAVFAHGEPYRKINPREPRPRGKFEPELDGPLVDTFQAAHLFVFGTDYGWHHYWEEALRVIEDGEEPHTGPDAAHHNRKLIELYEAVNVMGVVSNYTDALGRATLLTDACQHFMRLGALGKLTVLGYRPDDDRDEQPRHIAPLDLVERAHLHPTTAVIWGRKMDPKTHERRRVFEDLRFYRSEILSLPRAVRDDLSPQAELPLGHAANQPGPPEPQSAASWALLEETKVSVAAWLKKNRKPHTLENEGEAMHAIWTSNGWSDRKQSTFRQYAFNAAHPEKRER
jgi:hypothetical protein